MIDYKTIAEASNMIINGYAFTKEGEYVRILNLNCINHAAAIYDGRIVDTNMDDIENQIVMDYYKQNRQFMEDEDAEIL